MSTKKLVFKFVGIVVLLALVIGAVAVNFSSSASTSVAPAIMGMEGGASAPGPELAGSDQPEAGEVTLAGSSDEDLRKLPQEGHKNKKLLPEMLGPKDDSLTAEALPDAVAQSDFGIEAMPALITQFAGMDLQTWGAGWPPDTHGAVGPNHYIQAVNTSMAVYDKATGYPPGCFHPEQLYGRHRWQRLRCLQPGRPNRALRSLLWSLDRL